MTITKHGLTLLPCIHNGVETVIYRWDTDAYPKTVVIKMSKNAFPSARQIDFFVNEFKLTKGIVTPGIRAAYDYIIIDDCPALILEYVEGESLSQICSEQRLTLEAKVTIALSITRSLVALHKQKIIHRRLSNTNILYENRHLPATLIDFANASKTDATVVKPITDDMPVPLLNYISPEQTGKINRTIDMRSDLYSLGVVFYELFACSLPYEATSATELVHCHIARMARPVYEINPDIPTQLSAIIAKLMAKNVTDRYQSAYGLQIDLENCVRQLSSNNRIEPFTLAQSDSMGIFRIPQTLYGREQASRIFAKSFAGAGTGRGACLLLRGNTGSGKSVLIAKFKRFVAKNGGYFAYGEPSEYQRKKPYSAIVQAVNDRIDQILTENTEQLALRKERMLTALEDNGALLLEIFPRLELITGIQPFSPDIAMSGVQNRFHAAFLQLLSVLADNKHPLIICIDNLQWIDYATMEFLKMIWAKVANYPLLFVGAFNDGKMSIDSPLHQLLEISDRSSEHVTTIPLKNISADELHNLVCDTLNCAPGYIRPLSDLIYEKTKGSPRLTTQLLQQLYEDTILVYNSESQQWQWDTDKIHRHDAVAKVLRLMSQKLEKLPPATFRTLSWAACLGNTFDLVEISIVTKKSVEYMIDALGYAIQEGLVLPLGEQLNFQKPPESGQQKQPKSLLFSFSHNRVRKAILTRLSRKENKTIHLAIGRFHLQGLQELEKEERIFDIVDHLNEGFQYIRENQEKLHLAKLNLIAGRKAKRLAAHQTAIWYLSMGIGILPYDKWLSQKKLTIDLYLESVEAEYLCGNTERAEVLSTEALQYVDDKSYRIKFHELKLLFYSTHNAGSKTVATGIEAMVNDFQTPTEQNELLIHVKKLTKELILRGREERVSLDSETIIKASRMLSQEIKLEQLLDILIRIAMENAGAEKGILIEQRESAMLIQAKGVIGNGQINTMQAIPIEQSGEVALSVVNYVARTQKVIVLNDAYTDSTYSHDWYIAEHHIKSLLCLPIIGKGQLLAILYLENNLTSNAFTPDRLELLKAISSQAAISLENARLYSDLEQKFRELRQAEERLHLQTKQLEEEIAERRTTQIALLEQATHLKEEIEERKKAKLSLQESERRLRTMFEGAPIGMYRTSLDGQIINANTAMATMLGYGSVKEMIEKINSQGGASTLWMTREDRLNFIQKVSSANGRYVQQEITLRRQDGKLLDTFFYMMRTTDPDNFEPCLVGFVEDLNELKRLEGELRQSQKMESIGRLAGGVAHDFNNMLTVILGAAELALFETPPESVQRRYLESIQSAAKRSQGITRQLLSFSRKEIITPIAVNLNTLVIDSEKNLGRLIGEDIKLSFQAGNDLWTVKLDPSQLDQIIMNLSINARDAMPDGGDLTIATNNIAINDDYGKLHLDMAPGDYVQLTVSDTGCGMERKTVEHIFEPFFTTKEIGQGTGLGLATVYGIVSQNNGIISVYSEPGHGTTFRIYFPRLYEKAMTEKPSAPEHHPGCGTILLVEDEELLLNIATVMLEKCGYTIIQAATPQEAINICKQGNHHIDLILTDVVMPGMNGKEMVEQIKTTLPDVRVLFMSGYTDDILVKRGIVEEGTHFIQKPLEMKKLNEKIRDALA